MTGHRCEIVDDFRAAKSAAGREYYIRSGPGGVW